MRENSSLKPIYFRKLKNGNYVILSANSEPLVVEEAFAKYISQNNTVLKDCDENTISIFKDSGFFTDELSDTFIPVELQGIKWDIFRYGIFALGIISLIVIFITMTFVGIPFGNRIISINVSLWKSIMFLIIFSILTTIIHEMMHMLYARTWNKRDGRINIILKESVATVTMTHIWVWSFLGRLSAVSAGVISDLFILSICSILRLYFDNWIMAAASSILFLRILWQFRFHKKSDGRLIVMILLDNPTIRMDNEKDSDFFDRKDILVWKICNVVGIGVDILVFIFWIIPLVFSICSNIFATYFI